MLTKMNTKRLFAATLKNNPMKLLMSTQTEFVEALSDKKLQHYRNLNALENNDTKPFDWEQAKAFEEIPGPKPLPLVGNTWRFLLPKVGNFYGMDILQIHKQMRQQYGDITIMKGLVGLQPIVVLFNPSDIEKLHRNEGVWPTRHGLPSFAHYRKLRKNILSSGGLICLQGEEWFKFRTVVNPILMQPKNVIHYADKMNFVADELVDNIKYLSEENEQGQMPDDFHNELYKWSLESIGVVTMDTHLGCLKRGSVNEEAQKLIYSVLRMFQLMYKLDVMPSVWKYISTPSWKEYVQVLDFMLKTNLKHINRYIEKIEKGEIDNNQITSALHQMIQIDRNTATAMSVDMMIAGVDTTGRVLAAALYYLAKNPDKQELLRSEANNLLKVKDAPVTKETLSKNVYTKAVVKETTRLSPIAIGNLRTTKKDLVLGGYQVPSGTDVLTSTLMLSQQEEHFPKAKEFLPERWLKTTTGEFSHKNTNPFVFAPFGFGARSCIGKRFANLELETALLKIIRNFELQWPHEDMVFYTTTLHGMAKPLKIHVKPVNN
ncbi:probable cytochrome P450 12a4, mitochondrial [Zophobas morio]|uniref:probable cytochrome P450 12a4, mitochondrial n=1 Tax=Zophobas morio TaxID=2755281 RepID=UPI003082F2E7